MATTQYIGARYVPIFADPAEWNNTRAYEPLTIVMHEGNSYTSRQYVPKGIDINNDDFWALTGNYNAQVEQYRREVVAYEKEVTEVASTLSTVQLDYEKSYDTVATMQSDETIKEGMCVKTLGFHSVGDNGGAFYTIKSGLTANGMDIIACQNNLFAKLVSNNAMMIPEQYGAFGDGITNDAQVFAKLFNAEYGTIYLSKQYLIDSPISTSEHANSTLTIVGNGYGRDILIGENGSIVFGRSRVHIYNTFLKVLSKSSTTDEFAITFTRGFDCTFINCTFLTTGRNTMKINTPAYTFMYNTHMSYGSDIILPTVVESQPYSTLLYVDGGEYLYIDKSSFEGKQQEYDYHGLVLRVNNDVYITGCDFANFPISEALVIRPKSAGVTRYFINTTTFIRNYIGSIKLVTTEGYMVQPMQINGSFWAAKKENIPLVTVEKSGSYYPALLLKAILRNGSWVCPVQNQIWLSYMVTANAQYLNTMETRSDHTYEMTLENLASNGGTMF